MENQCRDTPDNAQNIVCTHPSYYYDSSLTQCKLCSSPNHCAQINGDCSGSNQFICSVCNSGYIRNVDGVCESCIISPSNIDTGTFNHQNYWTCSDSTDIANIEIVGNICYSGYTVNFDRTGCIPCGDNVATCSVFNSDNITRIRNCYEGYNKYSTTIQDGTSYENCGIREFISQVDADAAAAADVAPAIYRDNLPSVSSIEYKYHLCP